MCVCKYIYSKRAQRIEIFPRKRINRRRKRRNIYPGILFLPRARRYIYIYIYIRHGRIANRIPFNPVWNSSPAQSEMRSNVGSLISSAAPLLVHAHLYRVFSPRCAPRGGESPRKMDKPAGEKESGVRGEKNRLQKIRRLFFRSIFHVGARFIRNL